MGTAVAPSAHGIRTRRLHGVRSGGAGRRGRGSAADCRAICAAVTHPAQTIKFSPAFFKRLRGMKGGSAPFYSAHCAALCAMRSRKRPCQPKTAKRIFGGPGSQGPPGRQKSEREFCLFGGFFLRPARRAMCRAGRSCAADRCCGGFCTRCLFALRAALYARFSFVFCLFLFGCCLSKFFSFVAQAATGLYFLPKRK